MLSTKSSNRVNTKLSPTIRTKKERKALSIKSRDLMTRSNKADVKYGRFESRARSAELTRYSIPCTETSTYAGRIEDRIGLTGGTSSLHSLTPTTTYNSSKGQSPTDVLAQKAMVVYTTVR